MPEMHPQQNSPASPEAHKRTFSGFAENASTEIPCFRLHLTIKPSASSHYHQKKNLRLRRKRIHNETTKERANAQTVQPQQSRQAPTSTHTTHITLISNRGRPPTRKKTIKTAQQRPATQATKHEQHASTLKTEKRSPPMYISIAPAKKEPAHPPIITQFPKIVIKLLISAENFSRGSRKTGHFEF